MSCEPKCLKTASLSGPGGNRIMMSQPGNLQFPIAHTPHPQCPECAAAEYKEMMNDIAKLKDAAALGPGLAADWERLQAKTNKVLNGSK